MFALQFDHPSPNQQLNKIVEFAPFPSQKQIL